MKAVLLSSLAKVFKDTEPNFNEFNSATCLKNERFSFQIALLPEKKCEEKLEIRLNSSLKDIRLYLVENIPAGKTLHDYSDTFHYDGNRKEFPDLLRPVNDEKISLKKGEWSSLWVERVPASADKCGKKKITVTLGFSGGEVEKTFSLDLVNALLPKQELLYTNWFHNDCICTYYNIEPMSERYWEVVKGYIQNAVEHGMNMILTPVFTPPLDTEIGKERPTVQLVDVEKTKDGYKFGFENFRRYVALCLSCGIDAFEISHLYTQWGAAAAPKIIATVDGEKKRIFGWETDSTGKEYTEFLEAFAKAFTKEVKALGIKDKCWIHVSDEPNANCLETYKKNSETVRRIFKGFHSFDALSDIDFYRLGLIETPVCGIESADAFRKEVKHFWTYHCCGHTDNFVPNRMFCQPSLRNRILGVLLYKYDAEGFLQWGHNFWYSACSRREIDPFTVTDADDAFPSGDAFVVYPDKNETPLNSLRNKVFSDAMQDLRALKALKALTSREYVLSLIERGLDVPLSFNTYPHEQSWLLGLREEINKQIKARAK